MKKDINLDSLKPIVDILKRSNFTIFIVLVVVGLIFAVITLNSIVHQAITVTPDSQDGSSTSGQHTFDTATIERVNQLNQSNNNTAPATPNTRTNPFR
jgi:hypothetical protein